MPKRTDIKTILIIGSGPIVIGQGCEFDYSGVQACRALRAEGYRIVLINSNPATIMTDPEFADATYIEPITPETVEKILAREQKMGTPVDALLPTLGGQTGLNTAMSCYDKGILTKYNVQMIGANRDAIHRGEDRLVFKDLMIKIGLKVPRSGVVHNMDDARKVLADIGLPLIIRPAFTLGGTGGGIAYNVEEFEATVQRGLDASPVTEVLIEQSVIGWKEFEMEVVRDRNDNCIIICSIENIDAMGVHTGDSITVAPIQTLTDKEYQRMRDASFAVIRAVGVETGGSNIQFAINPTNGDMIVVEMNPRVSRSSALASKATGYPIAKIAALLAVGYTLDELPNFITSRRKVASRPLPVASEGSEGAASVQLLVASKDRGGVISSPNGNSQLATGNSSEWDLYTSACFEPTIDYCVVKIPRWTFEKFPDADETLTTQMKSVGEAMAIGRTFKEALQKGIRSMEVKRFGFGLDAQDKSLKQGEFPIPLDTLRRKLAVPSQGRLYYVRYALKMGWTIEQVHELTKYDPWFIAQMKELVDFEITIFEKAGTAKKIVEDSARAPSVDIEPIADLVDRAKAMGYSDVQLANAFQVGATAMRRFRLKECYAAPVFKIVDTCAAEFEASTPYYYSTYESPYVCIEAPQAHLYEDQSGNPHATSIATSRKTEFVVEDEIRLTDKPKVIIIGGGPNRIGQGIEFDYCCVQAAFAMRELGIESVMINSNPETVSTDYDTSDMLFFEPLTHEDVLNVCERVNGGPFGKVANAELRVASEAKGDLTSFSTGNSQLTTGNLVLGVIVQFGGQTPLNLARGLSEAGVPILGTSIDALDAAGDREQFRTLLQQLGMKQPENGIARSVEEAREIAKRVGYPVLVRPSFVLGGRAMEIVSDEQQLNYYMANAVEASTIKDAPILVDKFLDNATEVDVDCLADFDPTDSYFDDEETHQKLPKKSKRKAKGALAAWNSVVEQYHEGNVDDDKVENMLGAFKDFANSVKPSAETGEAIVIGVMEHIEEAGIHSGDSACALPPYSLSAKIVNRLREQTKQLAKALRVRGLMNVQYAIKDDEIYVIEVNPRASRTVPFVSKATGIPWAKIAAKVMAGKTLAEMNVSEPFDPKHTSVKEVVFPFTKFPGVDVILGPEMRSTGEVMGIDANFPLAFAKSQIAAGTNLPTSGTVFISVRESDKTEIVPLARQLADHGFKIIATAGTAKVLSDAKIAVERIPKLSEGRPNIKDIIKNKQVQLILNTPTKKGPNTDEGAIRSMAVLHKVPMMTTLTAAAATVKAILEMQKGEWDVKPLQAYHEGK